MEGGGFSCGCSAGKSAPAERPGCTGKLRLPSSRATSHHFLFPHSYFASLSPASHAKHSPTYRETAPPLSDSHTPAISLKQCASSLAHMPRHTHAHPSFSHTHAHSPIHEVLLLVAEHLEGHRPVVEAVLAQDVHGSHDGVAGGLVVVEQVAAQQHAVHVLHLAQRMIEACKGGLAFAPQPCALLSRSSIPSSSTRSAALPPFAVGLAGRYVKTIGLGRPLCKKRTTSAAVHRQDELAHSLPSGCCHPWHAASPAGAQFQTPPQTTRTSHPCGSRPSPTPPAQRSMALTSPPLN